jgi:maleylpyruvate isomerase
VVLADVAAEEPRHAAATSADAGACARRVTVPKKDRADQVPWQDRPVSGRRPSGSPSWWCRAAGLPTVGGMDPEVPGEWIDLWERGEEHLATALGRLVESDYARPSLLPGWTRAHVLAHLARNADGLVNLLTWARTGTETPMYASPEARDRDIEQTAARPPRELEADVLGATGRLAAAVREMPPHAWAATVRTSRGKEIAAADVVRMRAQEVWVHAVDLDSGVEFAEVPAEVLAYVVDEVFRTWDARDEVPDVVLFAGDREWGTGRLAVAGSLPDAAAWVTGRSDGGGLRADGPLPQLPRWV